MEEKNFADDVPWTEATLDTALDLIAEGISVIPIQARSKIPALETWKEYQERLPTEEEVRSWFPPGTDLNIAVICGEVSGNLVIHDFDTVEAAKKWAATYRSLVAGAPIVEPSRGWHVWTRTDKPVSCSRGEGFDIKGTGGYALCPPSIHPSGKKYALIRGDLAKIPVIEAELLGLARSEILRVLHSTSPVKSDKTIEIGSRNVKLTSLAGSMRRQGFDQAAILAALQEYNTAHCDPPLDSQEIKGIAVSVCKYKPEDALVKCHLSDLGNAERMAKVFDGQIKYCDLWTKWLIWDRKRWKVDDTKDIFRKARETIKTMYRVGMEIKDNDERMAFIKYAAGTERLGRLRAMIELCTSEPAIPVVPDQLDTHPLLLNVQNGILNLENMQLAAPNPKHFITKLSGTIFDQDAECPLWDSFLNRITDGNQALSEFLQKAVGWALSGDVSEQIIFIFYGRGANGKSTFLNTILKMMKDYGTVTPTESLLAKRGDTIPNDIARLKGLRFVSATEVQSGRRLNEGLIKQLAGGDPITARFLHAEFFTFDPEFKIFLGTNNKPVIKDMSHAMWRRIRLIPFDVVIPEDERDLHLSEKLATELPGILKWALGGFMMWKREGLGYPQDVKAATEEYRSEMDIVGQFLSDNHPLDPDGRIKASDLYSDYKVWCDDHGERALSQKVLGGRLSERGFQRERRTDGYWWIGLR